MRLIDRKTSIKADPKNLEICQWYQYKVLYPAYKINDLFCIGLLHWSAVVRHSTTLTSPLLFNVLLFGLKRTSLKSSFMSLSMRGIFSWEMRPFVGVGAVQLQKFTTLSHLCSHWRWMNLALCVVKRSFTRQLIGQCWEMLMLIGSLLTCNML